ncbi:MAG: class I SAM-dependent methyltransferase [Phenylobacterium sp.]|jgi:cyclopropane fatty-acyl-phospholipid synthase-like methyltransferase|uniref:SAM-dependent methyltransferase n=1 Tax=Phenylobacterium sp. TaxID=1871053 RepID=UPI001B3F3C53|nr:class I SAM-dependent methyltransferase [Phenylobacterium sp.]MBP7648558.1 class I SAM-dependent methyltransferase [Phenylobacterium sp.]MBP7814957.1 class I SAM-dependent methyltransferase [Phenylobacterium sp.]
MSGADNLWDRRYAQSGYLFGVEPNAFLARQVGRLQPGWRALAVADGEGRNGVWLAQQGLSVVSVDSSAVAQAKARSLAQARGVEMDFEQVDLSAWAWPRAEFDLVVAIFIQFAPPALRTQLFADMAHALKPGGLLLLQGYRPEQIAYATGGPSVAENLYTEPLLRDAFAGLEILDLQSHDTAIHEGVGHDGLSALIDLVARRPA